MSRTLQLAERAAVAVLAAAILFIVLFWRLGAPTFWDPDEAHYAETSREMMAAGDWLAPYYNEEPFFDKPVLFHQLQGAAMVVFGATEFAARLVPALAALTLVGITAWFGSIAASRSTGVVGALLLAVSPGIFGLARYAILDTLFTAFVFGGAALVAVAAIRDRPRLQWPGYVLVAFAVLTKGPLALVLCGLTLLLACVASADLRRRLLGLRWGIGLILILGLSAPWFVYMYLRFRRDFVNGYVLDENVRLFAVSRFANQPGPWFYVQILATGLLPWTGLLVGRLVDDVVALVRGERLDAVETLLWCWTLTILGFFSASTFKLDHYVFPAAPALCLLMARAWVDLRNDPRSSRHAAARIGSYVIGPALVIIGIGCGYFLIARLDLPRGAILVPTVITFCGVLTTLVEVRRHEHRRLALVPWFGLIAFAVTYGGLILYALPALEQRKVVPDLARFVHAHSVNGERVASYRLNRWTPAFRFYVEQHTEFLDAPPAAEAFFGVPQPFYCVMHRPEYEEFVARGVPLRVLYERDGVSVTSGRNLWRRRPDPTRFVVVTAAR